MTAYASLPVDVATMRATAARLLADDTEPLSPDELDTLTLTLRGHLELLIPEAERGAKEMPDDAPVWGSRSQARSCSGRRPAGNRTSRPTLHWTSPPGTRADSPAL